MDREKQIEEKHELSKSIYMSGYGLDWKDRQVQLKLWCRPEYLEFVPETFRDRLKREHPEKVGDFVGGCCCCPCCYGYEPEPTTDCCEAGNERICRACWDRPIPEQTETTQSEPKIEEKPKKKVYAISYEQFFFGKHYNRYVQFVETEDIFHEVGVLIYKASTAVRNIRWVKLRDVSIEAAIARYMSEDSEDWKRINGTNILRFIGDNDI